MDISNRIASIARRRKYAALLCLLLVFGGAGFLFRHFGHVTPPVHSGTAAALARKPSHYEQPAWADSETDDAARPGHLPQIAGKAEFARIARVYNAGTEFEMPHALFLIDRRDTGGIHYINTLRYPLHERFIAQSGLFGTTDIPGLKENYLLPDRRFLMGTVSWQNATGEYVYEFWEGDQLTVDLLRQTQASISRSFFAPVRFKTNSTLHERIAQQAGIGFVTQAELIGRQSYLPLNTGEALGRVRILQSLESADGIRPSDIVLLREVPIGLPPVAGIVTEQPSTLLSHVNMLAKGWGIPNMYLRDATQRMRAHDGQWVKLKVAAQHYSIEPIAQPADVPPAARKPLPKPDLRASQLLPLSALRARHQPQCGAKSANLGVVKTRAIPGIVIPDGFCIPFSQYHDFARQHDLAARVAAMQALPGFASDADVRKQALAALREEIVSWPVDPRISAAWIGQWKNGLHGKGVFVRSSSNSEDLPDFSGAGLYSTVPNITTEAKLEQAVKQVWASVFNFEAYEARNAFGFPADAVYMSVLVQTAVDADSAGVLITRDPYDAARKGVTYISAKRGIGIRVVEGQRIAEQVMYSRRSDAIQVISRSAEQTQLRLGKQGGVEEITSDAGRSVLDDALVRRLADMGAAVKKLFSDKDQDIEWAVSDGRVLLLQTRPYQ